VALESSHDSSEPHITTSRKPDDTAENQTVRKGGIAIGHTTAKHMSRYERAGVGVACLFAAVALALMVIRYTKRLNRKRKPLLQPLAKEDELVLGEHIAPVTAAPANGVLEGTVENSERGDDATAAIPPVVMPLAVCRV